MPFRAVLIGALAGCCASIEDLASHYAQVSLERFVLIKTSVRES